ncbi:MAG: hypothetical protein ACI8RZ_002068 [Myxococcota bacterium]
MWKVGASEVANPAIVKRLPECASARLNAGRRLPEGVGCHLPPTISANTVVRSSRRPVGPSSLSGIERDRRDIMRSRTGADMKWESIGTGLRLREATRHETERASAAILRFQDSGHPQADSRGRQLLIAFAAGVIDSQNLLSLSRWCHTSGARVSGVEPAQAASRSLFGTVLSDLSGLDSHNIARAVAESTEGRPLRPPTSVRKPSIPFNVAQAIKGSQSCIQKLVNQDVGVLNQAIVSAFPNTMNFRPESLRWVSPLSVEHFREYRDDFLKPLGLDHLESRHREFWPRMGPQWDALATIGDNEGVVLVEAKAHPGESWATCKASPGSRAKIGARLRRVQSDLDLPHADWTKQVYQIANRLAFRHFLANQGVPTWLAFVFFIDDQSYRPTPIETWTTHWRRLLQLLEIPNEHSVLHWVAPVYVNAPKA